MLFNYKKNFIFCCPWIFLIFGYFHLTPWLLEADHKINRPGPKFIFWPILLFVVTNLFLPALVMPAEMLFVVRVTEKESLALLASLDSITVRTLSSLCLKFSVSPLFILLSLSGAGDKKSGPVERSSLCMQANTVFRKSFASTHRWLRSHSTRPSQLTRENFSEYDDKSWFVKTYVMPM